jgi:hypothetical protein
MFENFYLREKEIEIAAETITLTKFNIADRAILAPVVGAILGVAQKKLTDKPTIEEETKPVEFDLKNYDVESAITENKKWLEMVVYMLKSGIKGISTKDATALATRGEPSLLDALLVEIISFNYLEMDATKKK